MPPKPPPAASVRWLQVASVRLDRQHITKRLPARRLLDVVDAHVAIQAQVERIAAFLYRPLETEIASPIG